VRANPQKPPPRPPPRPRDAVLSGRQALVNVLIPD
jgi:hypothetical protein